MSSLQSRSAALSLKRETPARFTIGRDRAGLWVVEDRDRRVGGIFTSEHAAHHFAAEECGHDAAQIAHARKGTVLQFPPLVDAAGRIY